MGRWLTLSMPMFWPGRSPLARLSCRLMVGIAPPDGDERWFVQARRDAGARAALAPEMSRNSPCRGRWRWGAPRLHSADRPSLVRHLLRPFPRQSSCAHDGNSGLGGVHFASTVAIGFDEQFIKDRTQTRTRTRTSEPFLAWVGFSRLKHACTRPDKLPGGKTGHASPIPTLASIPI